MANQRFVTSVDGKPRPIDSENETIDFLSIKVGADKLEMSELDANTFSFGGKRARVATGVDDNDASTKSQMETAVGAVQTDLDTQVGILDARITAFEANVPKEYRELATEGQTLINVTGMSFDADNAVLDIELYVGGRRLKQSVTGDLDEDFRKNSSSQLEMAYALSEDEEIVVWKQGTSSGGGGGGAIGIYDEGSLVDGAVSTINFVGTGVTVSEVSPGVVQVAVDAGGGGGASDSQKVEYHTITAGEAAAKQFTMANTPLVPSEVIVDIVNAGAQQYNVDYLISGNVFDWDGYGLDGILGEGDRVRMIYFS